MRSEKHCRWLLAASRWANRWRTSWRVAATLGFVASLLVALPASAQAVPARAVLVRGTLPVRGVPHLPVNSIPALYGEYRWEAATILVWVVRDELFLTPEWTEIPFRSPAGSRIRAYTRSVATGEGRRTAFALRDAAYWILAEIPSGVADPLPFLEALAVRLAYFASQARSPADLSLPAVLEFRSR